MAKALKTKPAAKAAGKAPAKAVSKPKKIAAKPVAKATTDEIELLEVGTFAKFTGYVDDIKDEDKAFEKGDIVYIVAVNPPADGTPATYDAILAQDVPAYLADANDPDVRGGELLTQDMQVLTGKALGQARSDYLPIPSVGRLDEIIDAAGGDLILASQNLYAEIDQSFFYLGGVLAHARREGAYLTENGGWYSGETAWDDFCKAEFEFSGAKGADLARMYTTFAAIPGFDPATLAGTDWSKIREIQRYVTEGNYEELIEEAKSNTRADLKIKLVEKFDNKTADGKTATRTGGSNAIKNVTLTFRLPEESHQAITLALKEAQSHYGVNSDAEALERILVAWAEEHVSSVTKAKKVASKIAKADKLRAASKKQPAKAAA